MTTILYVAAGGALGSLARFGLTGLVHRHLPPFFPYGTFTVNAVGCLLIGVLAGLSEDRLALTPETRAFVLFGLLGGFTTFSTFSYETFMLVRGGELGLAVANAAGQVVVGLAAVWTGYAVTKLV